VLALVSVPGSIHYTVLPGEHREDLLAGSATPAATTGGSGGWWRVVRT
jgi:hypothetical protein